MEMKIKYSEDVEKYRDDLIKKWSNPNEFVKLIDRFISLPRETREAIIKALGDDK